MRRQAGEALPEKSRPDFEFECPRWTKLCFRVKLGQNFTTGTFLVSPVIIVVLLLLLYLASIITIGHTMHIK